VVDEEYGVGVFGDLFDLGGVVGFEFCVVGGEGFVDY